MEVRVRAVWVGVRMGEGIGVRTGLGPDNGEAEGGVLDALALGLWGCDGVGVPKEDGGEEEVSDGFVP